MNKNEKNLCEKCSHYEVCSLKGNCEKLLRELQDKEKLLENEAFEITVTCKHRQANTGIGIR